VGQKLNGMHQLLAYAGVINLLEGNVNTKNKYAKTLMLMLVRKLVQK
jgi:hypothetical protein